MKFSVIIPVYNVEAYLKRCVESVLSQDYRDYEIILIDDGSTDGSGAICDEYAAKYSCVQVLHKPNGGLSSARNAGLDRALGEYVLFLDSDDWIESGCLARFDAISGNGCDLVMGRGWGICDDGRKSSEASYKTPAGIYSGREYLSSGLAGEHDVTICCPYYIYRRQFIQEHGLRFYEGILHEDELWTPLALLAADTIYVTDYYFYYHYQRTGSIMHSANRLHRAHSTMTVCRELERAFAAHPDKSCKWLRNRMSMLFLRDIPYVPDRQKYIAEFGRLFPLKNAVSPRERSKALLFAVSPSLYSSLVKKKNS